MSKVLASIVILFFGLLHVVQSAPPYSPSGFSTIVEEWKDVQRGGSVPVKIYYPRTQGGSLWPVIIFSHGLGGSRDGYSYLGEFWAGCGYVSVHLQHVGSDTSAIGAGLKRAASAKNSNERVEDVKFALDQLAVLNGGNGPLGGKLDLGKVGMAGHSFGALTTQMMVGQISQINRSVADPRIKAAVILSPTIPVPGVGNYAKIFAPVATPTFHMTGTEDESPISSMKPADRRIPYDNMVQLDKYLVIFNGGDHKVFSGRKLVKVGKEARFVELIRESTTAFWDAYLKGDSVAKSWLGGGAFATELAGDGTFEKVIKQ